MMTPGDTGRHRPALQKPRRLSLALGSTAGRKQPSSKATSRNWRHSCSNPLPAPRAAATVEVAGRAVSDKLGELGGARTVGGRGSSLVKTQLNGILRRLCELASTAVTECRPGRRNGWKSRSRSRRWPRLRPLRVACRCRRLPVTSRGRPSACVCVLISSHEDASRVGSGPAHMTSFYHNPLFKDPLSK